MFSLRFTIRNFGNIKEAQIELKPLTVFMGFNNTGKTYLSYLLYDLLKSSPNISFNFDSELQDKVIDGLVRNRSYSIDLEEYLTKNRARIEKRINGVCKDFGKRVLNSKQSFGDAEFEIENIFSMRDENENSSVSAELYGRNIEAVFEGNTITIKTNKPITKRNLRKGSKAYNTFKSRLEDFLNFCVKSSLFPGEVFFLPAERATLIQMMGYLENLVFSYALLGSPIGLKLPFPVVDFKHYFEFYSSGKSFFGDVSSFLESEVLGGEVDIIQKNSTHILITLIHKTVTPFPIYRGEPSPSRWAWPQICFKEVFFMTKSELVEAIARKMGSSVKGANAFVNAFVDVVSEALKSGKSVSITGFGKFYVSQRGERTGRNPQTGEVIKIKPHKIPAFKAGQVLKQTIND
ncbi:HU family DNA-binding protein [Hippea maritima]|uniref:Histone family protein DNA-binding protein n=1 Tax=Hippea maritima (strain ATCC 700847 / DSM 10411 / MH2) TaxID=760142 RepID=F2LV51_HIPMA|nr:HU family DNA-binding protein [Hippea maritima]AEA33635.1 histone family protein DNA-binding protein [Hippea maritima DSM 10411]